MKFFGCGGRWRNGTGDGAMFQEKTSGEKTKKKTDKITGRTQGKRHIWAGKGKIQLLAQSNYYLRKKGGKTGAKCGDSRRFWLDYNKGRKEGKKRARVGA